MTYNKKWIQVFAIWISVIVPYCARGQDAAATPTQDPAPATDGSGIVVGAKIGTSLNQFSQPGTAVGVNFGAFGTYKVNDWLTGRLELLYSTQGGGISNYTRFNEDLFGSGSSSLPSTVGTRSIESVNPYITFNNIEIPLLAELSLPEFAGLPVKPMVLLGGSYSGVMSAIEHRTTRYNFYDGPSVDVAYARETVTDNYKRNQWAFIGGIGMNYAIGSRVFHFDIRYRQGMTQLNQMRYASTSNLVGSVQGQPGGKLYSSSITFNFGMTIKNF